MEIKPLHSLIFDTDLQWLNMLMETLEALGNTSAILVVMVLGRDLSKGPQQGKLCKSQIACAILCKQIIVPLTTFLLINFLRFKTTLFNYCVFDGRPVMFFILMISCMPPAMSFNLIAQLNDYG